MTNNQNQPSIPGVPVDWPHILGVGTSAGGTIWVGYLTTAENVTLVLSYNLAVGGASIGNNIVQAYPNDLVSQIGVFQSTYKNMPASAPWDSEDAVFAFWIGINE